MYNVPREKLEGSVATLVMWFTSYSMVTERKPRVCVCVCVRAFVRVCMRVRVCVRVGETGARKRERERGGRRAEGRRERERERGGGGEGKKRREPSWPTKQTNSHDSFKIQYYLCNKLVRSQHSTRNQGNLTDNKNKTVYFEHEISHSVNRSKTQAATHPTLNRAAVVTLGRPETAQPRQALPSESCDVKAKAGHALRATP